MDIILVALNSKFIHSALGLRYLREYCSNKKMNIYLEEYTINEPVDKIILDIGKKCFDVICFSCYIWNIEIILKICSSIKKINPECNIVLGGPEVSFNPNQILSDNPFIDYIVYGEGEETCKELLECIYSRKDIQAVKGIAYRYDEEILINDKRELIQNLDSIPFPYKDMENLEGKIIYYETTRGCPFNCSYCLSSTIKGVRAFSLERVKKDLLFLINKGVKQVKFVDRTFNLDTKRTLQMFEFLSENYGNTCFHFEIAGDILEQETIEFLKTVPKDIFQFEIGVQTTNSEVLSNVNRKTDIERLKNNVKKLIKYGNIHIHLDLIAGLPGENYESFVNSFNEVYMLNPHHLQLGFLKLLKGSNVRKEQEKFNFIFNEFAPYEVISNNSLTYNELAGLKEVEDIVEKYYNTQSFKNAVKYIIKNFYYTPYTFYKELSEYFVLKMYNKKSHSRKELYKILLEYYETTFKINYNDFRECLKFDYILEFKNVNLPIWFNDINEKEKSFQFLKDENLVKKYIPDYFGQPAKKIIKNVGFKIFNIDILNKNINTTAILFDFKSNKYYDVTESWFGLGDRS